MRAGIVGVLFAIAACDPNMALVGKPCTPPTEDDPTYLGADEGEVSLFATDAQLAQGAITCMSFHFRGRVACPYGGSCLTPSGAPVKGQVAPQCLDRRAADTVTYTCRCANADGKTDDGANYCSCPSDTACSQLVTCFGECSLPQIGAFCIPQRANLYDPSSACLAVCDPQTAPCP